MLLISPDEVSQVTGVSCGGSGAGGSAEAALIAVLGKITPRLEDAMNVASLLRGNFTDFFSLSGRNAEPIVLRLSNGYVVDGSVKLHNSEGVEIDASAIDFIDYEYGTVTLSRALRGRVAVTYTSGFEAKPEPEPAPGDTVPPVNTWILQGVPEWMKALASLYLVEWYRTARVSPSIPKGVSISAMDSSLRRHVHVRTYERYMRPRVNVVWSDRMVQND